MTDIRPRRSVLYMPGSNARALEKARDIAADALILDLEDAVAPDAKAMARDQVCAAVKAGGYGRRELVIRTNGVDTPWFEADLAAAAEARPDAILIPKVQSARDAEADRPQARRAAGPMRETRIWAMIETPLAILDCEAIAAAAQDPQTPAGLLRDGHQRSRQGDPRALRARPRADAALADHGASWPPAPMGSTSSTASTTTSRTRPASCAECEQGRDLGFDGKTLIHPGQVAAANAVFAPDEAELARAHAIIAAFDQPENAGKGAIQLDGRMVERLHAEMARRVVALAQAIAG